MRKTRTKKNLRLLSTAMLIGTVAIGVPAMANDVISHSELDSESIVLGDEASLELLKTKPVETPTLDYLKDNKILIPQKDYQRDEDGNLVLDENNKPIYIDAKSVTSQGSSYTITEGTEEDHLFEYKTADKDGNVITKYYNIEVCYSELDSEFIQNNYSELDVSSLGTSKNVTWKEVDEAGEDTITVKLPNNVTRYFQYTVQADNYTNVVSQTKEETLTDPTGTSSSHYQYIGGSAENNTSTDLVISDVLYQNNNTSLTVDSTNRDYKYVDVFGGAIYNAADGEITSISADFIGNSINATMNGDDFHHVFLYLNGGAIYNGGTIGNVTGNFIGNTASSNSSSLNSFLSRSYSYGGAIYNIGAIADITGDFIGNTVSSSPSSQYYESYSYGGAIYNGGTIGDITGDFIGNAASSYSSTTSYYYYSYGGAIYNTGTIGDIAGDFIGNSASTTVSSKSSAYGGAIYNTGTIGNITGDFIGNTVSSKSSYTYGGAIYNLGTIGDITGDFIENSAYEGGAIYNSGTIGDIIGDFISNSRNAIYNKNGTIGDIIGDFISNSRNAIYNKNGTIGDISGDFINNSDGGICNYNGTIGNISGNFIGNSGNNYSITNSDGIVGNITGNFINNSSGIICNSGKIGDITGKFIGNGYLWAITNSGIMNNVTSDFIGNSRGAIFNDNGTIGGIYGNFISNSHANGSSTYLGEGGGAICNSGTIGDIIGDFISNSTSSSYWSQWNQGGGAIHNTGTIGNITGDFISNTASSEHYSSYDNGGAIHNRGTIADITGDFINNSAYRGGAIFNYHAPGNEGAASIGNITGNFIGNSAESSGGAIYNEYSNIGNITGDFINNSGEAIYNYIGTIGNITGNFIGNSAESSGRAIYNHGTIGDIIGNFIGNSTSGLGGAIYTSIKMGDITGDFINNSATYRYSGAFGGGGAIYVTNNSQLGDITGNFINNSASFHYSDYISDYYNSGGGAIYNESSKIGDITGNFIGNSFVIDSTFHSGGGAIGNYGGIIGNITGNFINNSASSSGGAIYNVNGRFGDILGDFIGNSASFGGAIYSEVRSDSSFIEDGILPVNQIVILNDDGTVYTNLYICEGQESDILELVANGTITDYQIAYTAEMSKSVLEAQLDGMSLEEYIELVKQEGLYVSTENPSSLFDKQEEIQTVLTAKSIRSQSANIKLFNSNILSNYVEKKLEDIEAPKGGAIYSNGDTIKLTANNGKTTLISGNYVKNGDEVDDNAIYMNGGKLIFDTVNGSTIKLDDNIKGQNYKTYIIGDKDSRFVLNNSINDSEVNLVETNLYLTKDNWLDNNNLNLHSGTISLLNNQVGVSALNTLTIVGNTDFVADVDLANKTMDRFTAKEYGDHQGNLNIVGVNLLSDTVEGEDVTAVYFAESGLKNNVTYNGLNVPNNKYQDFEAYTPIYKYNVTYDNQNEYDGKGDGGYFLFSRGGSTGNESEAFNPSVLSAPVSSVSASQATVNETFKYVFEHADSFTKMPAVDRMTKLNANKYASTDFNNNLCNLCEDNNKAGWFRPYVTFETMNLNHGPKVNAITYGSLAGFDTDFHEHKHGWHSVGTGYIGYNGNQLHYSGVDTTMNGGLLGYTHTMYKGNFWSALTLSAGASVGESRTMYGKEDFTSLMAGVGTKTGYNFEFKEGKYILQPIMFMSYTFVNTFDYTNAAGVKIKPSPAHSIQLNPSVRFITNTKNGWQPYASVGMVWNVMNENKVMANSVRLPEMSMKPYVEYGLGIQRNWKDRFTAFGQAMIRNGGRNGIALTGGFRWALGKEAPKTEKVQNGTQAKDRTVLKQLTPAQKTALGARVQNTTRTTSNAVLKSL